MGLGSIYTDIGLAQGLGGMPQAYAQGQQAAQQLALQKLQQESTLENIATSRLSRQQALMAMKQKETERQDALRRQQYEMDDIKNIYGLGGTKSPTETPMELPMNAMGTIADKNKPVISEFSALSVEPEAAQFNILKNRIPKLVQTMNDPNSSLEEKQIAQRDFAYYAPQIPKAVEAYKNWGYGQISRFASNPSKESLEKIKPIIQQLHPEVGSIVVEQVPAIDENGNKIKDKFNNILFSSIADENGISILVPIDPRLLTTAGDPKKIEDVLSKIESARQQRINAFAVSEREMRRYERTDRQYARTLKEYRLSMAPTWKAITDDKGVVVDYEPILGMYDDLLEVEMERLMPKYSQLPKKDRAAAIEKDPQYIKFKKSLIPNPRLNK